MLKARITDEEFEKLSEGEQMKYLWCSICNMFYMKTKGGCKHV